MQIAITARVTLLEAIVFFVLRTNALFAMFLVFVGATASRASAQAVRVHRAAMAHTPYRVVVHPVSAVPRAARVLPFATTAALGTVKTIPVYLGASTPIACAYDADDGNLYVLSNQSSESTPATLVFQVNPKGQVLLFATLPVASANGIAYDGATRSFYVSSLDSPANPDGGGPSLLSISSRGTVSLLAGGSSSGSVDGTGSAASFQDPSGIGLDGRDGALYVFDYDRVRRVTTGGVVTTLTKPNSFSYLGYTSVGLAYDSFDGNLYLANLRDNSIERISPKSGSVTAFTGRCYTGGVPAPFNCDPLQRDGLGLKAFFAAPASIAVDSTDGALYVADSNNNALRRIDLAGNVTTLAGSGRTGTIDGSGPNAEFDVPIAAAYDSRTQRVDVFDVDSSAPFSPIVALRSVTTTGIAAPAQTPIALFDTPSPDAYPVGIDWRTTKPRATSLVYSEQIGRVGLISTSGISIEHADPSGIYPDGPFDAVYGSDGTSWLLSNDGQQLDHRSFYGTSLGSVPLGDGINFAPRVDQLTLGPDDNIWFTLTSGAGTDVGFVTPHGGLTNYAFPTSAGYAASLAFESDRKLWVSNAGSLIELDLTGHVLRNDAYPTNYLTQGPDGNVWFTESDAIGTVRPNNTIVVYPIFAPVPGCPQGTTCSRSIGAITAGADGALWFVENGAIGRLAIDGTFTEVLVPAARSAPSDITTGPDGNIWFVDAGAQKIGRLQIH